MIQRYTRPEMGRLWEQENRYRKWLEVEIAVCEAWGELGEIPPEAIAVIREKAAFDTSRIDEIEEKVKHDVIAFLTSVAEVVGPESRFIHIGLTSSDVTDTALNLLMREAADIIIADIRDLMDALREKAFTYRLTPCIGRSHGVHAEPMTFGLKFALWYSDLARNLERMERAKRMISVCKISGAVGTFSNITPVIEEKVSALLGLTPEAVATQVVQRDRHADYMSALALSAAAVEKIALEMRHLQRTEVREAEEPFTLGQKGSSAMPHKRNPIGAENLCGLSRLVRSNMVAAFENIALWHERDISHSSVERIIIPDSTILLDYMLTRLTGMIREMNVYPDRMHANLDKSFGLYNSQKVMLALVDKGLTREDAYEIVQRAAMESWNGGWHFKYSLLQDREASSYLGRDEIEDIFDVRNYLKNVDYIFKRVFPDWDGN